MKVTLALLSLIPFALAASIPNSTEMHEFSKRALLLGTDISDVNTYVDWRSLKANSIAFAYIEATKGQNNASPFFPAQYSGATNAGLIRGSYHLASPDVSSGATQATYFLAHGGGWSADGITLPGALHLKKEFPDPDWCYRLSISSMVSWIRDFSVTYHLKTGRYPVIYTTAGWWNMCTGSSTAFGSTNPLWIADYAIDIDPLPAGWSSYSFLQGARIVLSESDGPFGFVAWNGDMAGLQRFANGS